MRTLQEAIDKMNNAGGAGSSLRKHLATAGIIEWADITRGSLYDFHDGVCAAVAASTAKTVMANAKSLLNRYKHEVGLPEDWQKILSAKGCQSVKTYLTPEELRAFETYKPRNPREEIVKVESLVEAYTGARISDVLTFTDENFDGGYLTYTSKKTKVPATVPASRKIQGWVRYIQNHREDEPSMATRERLIRKIAEAVGIKDPVTVFKAGKTMKGPKWEHLSSHSFRISFVTNLQIAGLDLLAISRMAGHTNTSMTERYCAPSAPKLNDNAIAYFAV